jgi:hypothetical protein
VASLGTPSCTTANSTCTEVGSLLSRQVSVISWQTVISFHQALISSVFFRLVSILASISIFVIWQYNDQSPMQFSTQPLLTPVVTC